MVEGFKDAWNLVLCPENLSLTRESILSSFCQPERANSTMHLVVSWTDGDSETWSHSVLVVQLLGIQSKGTPPMTDFCCFSFNCLASAGNIHSTSTCLVLHIRVYDWGHFTFSWETGDTLFTKVCLLPVAMKIFAFTGYRNEISESGKDCIFHILLWDASCVHACVCVLICVWFFVTPSSVAHQAPLSMAFSRQEQVAISYSRGPSQPRERTRISCISCIGMQILYHCTTLEAQPLCSVQFSSVQSLSHVRLLATPWIAARQASLSITNYH